MSININNIKASGISGSITPAPSGDPYFSNVVLLLPLNGTNGSTTITDVSSYSVNMTASGNASISTAQSKFGGASAYFDGNGDYISTGNTGSNYDFGVISASTNYTIEFWARWDVVNSSTRFLVAHAMPASGGSGKGGWAIVEQNGKLSLRTSKTSSVVSPWYAIYETNNAVITANTWYYIAVVLIAGVPKIFLNGTEAACTFLTPSGIYATSLIGFDTTKLDYGLRLGSTYTDSTNPNPLAYFTGYIDELRVTKNVARYSSNYSEPTSPFPTN